LTPGQDSAPSPRPVVLPRLVALSPGGLAPGDLLGFLARVERALRAGLPGLLLREPALSDRETLRFGRALATLRSETRPWLALHDRAHLAAELDFDAVHLSFRSLPAAELRPWLDARIAVGLSTHAGDEPASWQGADYVFHGPLRATPAKPRPVEPVGLDGLARACARAACPVLALGGVTPADVPQLLVRGVHGVATLSGLLGAEDPERATQAWLEALG